MHGWSLRGMGGTPCLSLPPSFQEVLGLLNARQLDGSRK